MLIPSNGITGNFHPLKVQKLRLPTCAARYEKVSISELAMMLQSKIISGEERVFRYRSIADFNQ